MYMDQQLRNGRHALIFSIVLYFILSYVRYTTKELYLDASKYPAVWNSWHFGVMFLFGYLSPKYWYLYLSLSIAWELSEYYIDTTDIMYSILGKDISMYNPHDYLWNSLGLLAGVYASKFNRINLMNDIKDLIIP